MKLRDKVRLGSRVYRESRKRDTGPQLTVIKWLRELGLGFSVEEDFFYPYLLDIYIPDLSLAIELDGPNHRGKRDEKRDAYLKEEFDIDTWRFKNQDITAAFQEEFNKTIIARAEELEDCAKT